MNNELTKIETSKALLEQLEVDEPMTSRVRTLSYSVEAKVAMALQLSNAVNEIDAVIVALRSSDAGPLANEWFAAQLYINSIVSELRMWIELGKSNVDAAWGHFCNAEQQAILAFRFLRFFGPARRQFQHVGELERVVFPNQPLFVSSAVFVPPDGTICTICARDYADCDHIAGEIYDGRLAARKVIKIAGVREVSFVENPDNKACRVLEVDGIDPLTGLKRKSQRSVNKVTTKRKSRRKARRNGR